MFINNSDKFPSSINYLWWEGSYEYWKSVMKHYWSLLRPENIPLEIEFEHLGVEKMKLM